MHQSPHLLKIFIIYSREDVNALLEFKKSLAPLERRGEIEVWYDGEIIAGQEWEKAIKKNLSIADIIVLFLSNDFFSSEYIEKEELRQALDRHDRGEAVVTPVVIRHCIWQEHPQIERLQVLPNNAHPVFSKKHWDDPDEAFVNVANGIAKIARAILKNRQLNDPETIQIKEELYTEAELKRRVGEEKGVANAMNNSAAKQLEKDIQLIKDYLADNNLTATATHSGLHYIITQEGTGGHPGLSSLVVVRYKGYLLDGTVFDRTNGSSTITFKVDSLIEAWKEGIMLLKDGAKGTFFSPSALAYGTKGVSGIPPNTVLVFEIELVGSKRRKT